MEYNDSEQAQAVAQRIREFVDGVVLPIERDLPGGVPVSQELLDELRAEARAHDVFAPQVSKEYGGLGLTFRDALPAYEEGGRSFLAMPAIRTDPPDEGNIHLLELLGTDDQKDEWLRPLVNGDISSAFAMTEPMQGGGADPKMIETYAEKDGDEWVLTGHKWWITNGSDADFFLVMARTDRDAHPYKGCSILLVPADSDGIDIVRDIPHMGEETLSRAHTELIFDGVRVPEENILGTVDSGFQHAQQRMVPARLTRSMQFSGMAERALDIAKAFMSEREVFGEPVSEKQGPRFDVADARTRLHAARTMVRHAADVYAGGDQARIEAAMAKYFSTNVAQEVIDTALQFCGANGIGMDLPLAEFYQDVRIIRIADGPDEVQKRVIARDAFEDIDEREIEHVSRYMDPRTRRD
ncbi:acyl-CoA dehydrogenase family protein [Natrinema caseinilyticum]|uniref:acyl-CoA dehydrogenase family protein n=1 Tax=Natrinema caseinilyticum TaxID=2961570 RepID=UPI0020C45842|nr:acyl-CoA dehydrogenase family protein [Natrinema caseinilyticum]